MRKLVVCIIVALATVVWAQPITKRTASRLWSATPDRADTGVIRLGNNEAACWEAASSGVDACISRNPSDAFVIDTNLVMKPVFADPAGGSQTMLGWSQSTSFASASNTMFGISLTPAWTISAASPGTFAWYHAGGSIATASANNSISIIYPFLLAVTSSSSISAVAPYPIHGYGDFSVMEQTAGTANSNATVFSYDSQPVVRANGASAVLTFDSTDYLISFNSSPKFSALGNSSQLTYRRVGLRVNDLTYTTTGSPRGTITVAENIGVDVTDQVITAESSTVTVNLVAALRSAISSGTGKWSILSTGTANSFHRGGIRIGDATATVPTEKLEVAGNAVFFGPTITTPIIKLNQTVSSSGIAQAPTAITVSRTITFNHALPLPIGIGLADNIISGSGTGSAGAYSGMSAGGTVSSATSGQPILTTVFFNHATTYQGSGGVALGTTGSITGFANSPTFRLISSSTTATFTNANAFVAGGTSNIDSGATLTITTRRGLYVNQLSNTGGGTLSIGTSVGVDIDTLANATTNLSLRSAGSSVQMRHAGPGVFGANAAPTNSSVGLEVQSTTLAFLPSRMTTTQRDALTAVDGMVIYNTTNSRLEAREGGTWVDL